MKPIEKAVNARILQGEESKYFLYKYISKHGGLSGYELAKRLGWSYGKVNKALMRLGDLVYYKEVKTGYPYKKLVYATLMGDIPDGEGDIKTNYPYKKLVYGSPAEDIPDGDEDIS